MEMDKNTIIRSLKKSFETILQNDRTKKIDPKHAEIQAVEIARSACTDLKFLKGRKKDLKLL